MLHVVFDLAARASEQAAEALIEAELLALLAHEVEHGQHALAVVFAQASAELLQEDGGALGGAQHEDGVHCRHVDALVEQVDGEQDGELAVAQILQRVASFLAAGAAGDRLGSEPGGRELAGHELGVIDRHAETERPHGVGVGDHIADRGEHLGHPHVVAGVHVGQLGR